MASGGLAPAATVARPPPLTMQGPATVAVVVPSTGGVVGFGSGLTDQATPVFLDVIRECRSPGIVDAVMMIWGAPNFFSSHHVCGPWGRG